MKPKFWIPMACAGLSMLTVFASAQQLPASMKPQGKVPYGKVGFKANLGSFKLLGGGATPAQGHFELSFTGTVLVSGLEGSIATSGSVREELNRPKEKKRAFFGTGKIIVEGKYDGIQFFGRDVSGDFYGFGVFRLYGEFDKNLDTGEYWYEGQEHKPWGTGGQQLPVPKPEIHRDTVKAKVRDVDDQDKG